MAVFYQDMSRKKKNLNVTDDVTSESNSVENSLKVCSTDNLNSINSELGSTVPSENDLSDGDGWNVVENKKKCKKVQCKKRTSTKSKAKSSTNGEWAPKLPNHRVSANNNKFLLDNSASFDNPKIDEFESDVQFKEECTYCLISDPNSIIKCGKCNRWFCNIKNDLDSHIVHHFAKSGHNEVLLNEDLFPDCEIKLGCYICGQRNVFNLGFITDNINYTYVLLCRLPCSASKKLDDMNVNSCDWKPIIEDGTLLQWLAADKLTGVLRNMRTVTIEQLDNLEELWKENKFASFDDLETHKHFEKDPEQTKLRYKNADHYQSIFNTLVCIEEYCDKQQSSIQICDNVTVRWDRVRRENGFAYIAYFILGIPLGELHLTVNKDLRLRHRSGDPQKDWSREGHIVKVPRRILSITHKMRKALENFADDESCVADHIYRSLLGRKVDDELLDGDIPENLSVPDLPKLNAVQKYAIKQALVRRLCLIQGPPGTGKTVTSASIVYHLFRQHDEPVLVCAPSNTAVDNLTEKIEKTGLNVVRLFSQTREDAASPVLHLGLHVLITQMHGWDNIPELVKLCQEKQKQGILSPEDQRRYNFLKAPFEQKRLKAADVICCTCTSAGDQRLDTFEFHSLLIDECTQATEPECLIPLVHGVQQAILVGDHCQLGPVVLSNKARRGGLSNSLFERLLTLEIHLVQLKIQYRMHPALSKFSSKTFYQDSLIDGVKAAAHNLKNVDLSNFWPQSDKPMLFYSVYGKEEIADSGTSYLNRTEAAFVEQFVTYLFNSGMSPDQIGIITPYQGQRAFISQYMEILFGTQVHDLYNEIEVASVDSFQGREKDLIIFSCVRSNRNKGIGFLKDPRRLNVALTRARFGIIVIGNPKVLTCSPVWNNLLHHYNERNALVEGPFADFRKSNVKLKRLENVINFIKRKTFSAKDYFSK